jgi:hypothetical protein
MDKVKYVDWPTQNWDRNETHILLSLSFDRMRAFTQSNTYTIEYLQMIRLLEMKNMF